MVTYNDIGMMLLYKIKNEKYSWIKCETLLATTRDPKYRWCPGKYISLYLYKGEVTKGMYIGCWIVITVKHVIPFHEIGHGDHRHQHNQEKHQKLIDVRFTRANFTACNATVHGQFGVLASVDGTADSPFCVLDA